jgi:hypothetical protein
VLGSFSAVTSVLAVAGPWLVTVTFWVTIAPSAAFDGMLSVTFRSARSTTTLCVSTGDVDPALSVSPE